MSSAFVTIVFRRSCQSLRFVCHAQSFCFLSLEFTLTWLWVVKLSWKRFACFHNLSEGGVEGKKKFHYCQNLSEIAIVFVLCVNLSQYRNALGGREAFKSHNLVQ